MSATRTRGGRDERGFTLTELIVVVVIIGILSAVAIWGARRPTGDVQLDAAASSFRWAIQSARNRAMATHSGYRVEMSQANGFRYCSALPDYSACATAGTPEVSTWAHIGDKVVLDSYATATNIAGTAGAVTFGSNTVAIAVKPDGSIDGDVTSTTVEGFTIYIRTDTGSKQRKAYLYPLTAEMHITDHW